MGLQYKPPFDYFYDKTNSDKDHTILFADFATDESGTGIVHQAPEFGEEDFNLGKKEGITITEAMDDLGRYTDQITDLEGTFYRDANDTIMKRLAENGTLFHKASITHRVAFCPRTGIPLVYKAQNSWFIDIQNLKPQLLEQNEKINWHP